MSDPANDGYHCCGRPMFAVAFEELGPELFAPHVWMCRCGVWKHALPNTDPRRAEVAPLAEAYARAVASTLGGDA